MRATWSVVLALVLGTAGGCGLSRGGSKAEQQQPSEGGSTGVLGGGIGDGSGGFGNGSSSTNIGAGPGSGGEGGDNGTGGSGGSGGDGGGGAPPLTFAYRMPLTITADSSGMPAGYTVYLDFDHAALVGASKALASGDDVRLFRDTGGGPVEVDRRLAGATSWNTTGTRLDFMAATALAADASDTSYALYYGAPTAGAPPQNGANVYAVFDDFDGTVLDPAWQTTPLSTLVQDATATVSGGVLRLTARTADIGMSLDDCLFLHRQLSGDFYADALITARGGSFGGAPHLGGVMWRTTTAQDARMHVMAPTDYQGGSIAFFNDWRTTAGTAFTPHNIAGDPALPAYVGMIRFSGVSGGVYSDDFLGYGFTPFNDFGTLPAALQVGIAFANHDTATVGWVEIDWFSARISVSPSPDVTAGAEETL